MKDITNLPWIKAKGILFLLAGLLAATLLVLQSPTWKVAALLTLSVWCFCRCYFFAFYVIEHYVDPTYHFSGLWSFASYLLHGRKHGSSPSELGK